MTETEQKTAKAAFDAKIADLQAKLDAAEAKYIRDLGAYMRGDTPPAGGGEDKSIDALVKKLSK